MRHEEMLPQEMEMPEHDALLRASGGETGEFAEQQMMDETAARAVSEQEAQEQREMNEGISKLGYSSAYYKHKMETALANGNKIAYDNARKAWAKKVVEEETKSDA